MASIDMHKCIKCGHVFRPRELAIQVRIRIMPKNKPYDSERAGFACDNRECVKCDKIGYALATGPNDIPTGILYDHPPSSDIIDYDRGLILYRFRWNGVSPKTIQCAYACKKGPCTNREAY